MTHNSGKVIIYGREYKTVALRVTEFRDQFPDYGIETEIFNTDDTMVIMKATVTNTEGRVIGTGFAEEKRGTTQINRTSALENCETSAIGRALSACGFGGTEYASANEVQNVINQQAHDQHDTEMIKGFIESDDCLGVYLSRKMMGERAYMSAANSLGEPARSKLEAMFQTGSECLQNIHQALDADDMNLGLENLEGVTNTTKKWLAKILGPDRIGTIKQWQKEAA